VNYITNAFSLAMLDRTIQARCEVLPYGAAEAAAHVERWPEWTSAVGHADTAQRLSAALGLDVPANRASISLRSGDRLIVGQHVGPRLPEGATELPDGARFAWWLVLVT